MGRSAASGGVDGNLSGRGCEDADLTGRASCITQYASAPPHASRITPHVSRITFHASPIAPPVLLWYTSTE